CSRRVTTVVCRGPCRGEMAGTLYVVATPLGNLEDLSPRAAATLTRAAAVAAEDTRHTKPLLAHVGSRAELISFHAHSSDGARRGGGCSTWSRRASGRWCCSRRRRAWPSCLRTSRRRAARSDPRPWRAS